MVDRSVPGQIIQSEVHPAACLRYPCHDIPCPQELTWLIHMLHHADASILALLNDPDATITFLAREWGALIMTCNHAIHCQALTISETRSSLMA
jgi:hypothetical protein